MSNTVRNRLIAHKMAVDGKLAESYRAASAWVDEAWRVIQSAPDNPYPDADAFMADLLAKLESRQMPTAASLAAAMRSAAANPETDAQKIERLAEGFAGDCNGLLVGAEESEGDGAGGAGSAVWRSSS